MEKIIEHKIYFWCGIIVFLVLITSLIIKSIFFPIPTKTDIEGNVERYVYNKGDYLIKSVDVTKTSMRSDLEDCWYAVVFATENKNEDCQVEFQINYHPITGRIVSEYMYNY